MGYLLLRNLGMHALVKRVSQNVSLNIVPILECSTLIVVIRRQLLVIYNIRDARNIAECYEFIIGC